MGLRYEVTADKTDEEETRFIRFMATIADGRRNVLGVWLSRQYLVLALGNVSAKAEGINNIKVSSFTELGEPSAKPITEKPTANKLSPAKQKVTDAALEEAVENNDVATVRTLLARGAGSPPTDERQ